MTRVLRAVLIARAPFVAVQNRMRRHLLELGGELEQTPTRGRPQQLTA